MTKEYDELDGLISKSRYILILCILLLVVGTISYIVAYTTNTNWIFFIGGICFSLGAGGGIISYNMANSVDKKLKRLLELKRSVKSKKYKKNSNPELLSLIKEMKQQPISDKDDLLLDALITELKEINNNYKYGLSSGSTNSSEKSSSCPRGSYPVKNGLSSGSTNSSACDSSCPKE